MKTLHTYFSSKIAFILSFTNKMKSHMKFSFFLLSLARNTCFMIIRLYLLIEIISRKAIYFLTADPPNEW